jgi:hypothetical protein
MKELQNYDFKKFKAVLKSAAFKHSCRRRISSSTPLPPAVAS